MNPLELSARFAAYVWCAEVRGGQATHSEAARFARTNWQAFLPAADKGWGRLLVRLAKPPRRTERRRTRCRYAEETGGRPIEEMAEVR
jgi:hypothetical protein